MKRIISALVILVMMLSMITVNASAAGVIFRADFSTMTEEQFYAQFMVGEFHVDDVEGVLYGYNEAKSLQSMYSDPEGIFDNTLNTWLTYDASITLSMADDELVEGDRDISFAYCNDNPRVKGVTDARQFITLSYDMQKKEFNASVSGFPSFDEAGILADPIPMDLDIEGNTFYTLGMSVEKNRVRFFIDNQLLYDIDGTSMYVADSVNSPFFFWNGGNFIKVSEINVATATHLYPPMDTQPTPADTTAPSASAETTTRKEVVEVTDADGNVQTDADGNKITEEIIVTDAPVADTNTGAPQGGSSTNTGDISFIVVCAMVASLGCAVIVKKVNDR